MAKNWKESDLEQYTVNNLDKLKSCLFSSSKIEMNLIGTQIKCTFGRIDMLAWAERSLMVVEFKAVRAGEKELGQVMRYSTLIESVIDVYQHMSDVSFNFSSDVPYKVYPVIVAPSSSSIILLVAPPALYEAVHLLTCCIEYSSACPAQPIRLPWFSRKPT